MLEMGRIIYKNNPLVEVVCQLNFPAILSIDSTEPTAFQEKIREVYPQYKIGNEFEDEISVSINGSNAESQLQRHLVTRIHNFISQDNNKRVLIAKNRISFSVKMYEKWEDFHGDFVKVFEDFDEIYHPKYYNRIGLRYVNIIDRKKLGINNKWGELIKPQLLGFNSIENNKYDVINTTVHSEIVSNDMNARIISGTVLNNANHEKCYSIDCDYYKLDTFTKNNISDSINDLHANFQDFFNSFITEELKQKLGPIERS